MKKILLLSVNYPPMITLGSVRASRFVAKLPDLKWVPFVVAPADVAWGDEDKSRVSQESPGFSGVYRTGEPVNAAAFGPERVSQMLQGMTAAALTGSPLRMISGLLPGVNFLSGWEKQAAAVAEGIISRHDAVDAIYAQGPPAAPPLLALELSAKHGVPVLFDLVAPVDGIALPGGSRHDLARIEERVLTSGHSIMTPTRPLKEHFLKKYFGKVKHDDISIVSDFCLMQPQTKPLSMHKSEAGSEFLVFPEQLQGKEMKLFAEAISGFMQQVGLFRGGVSVRIVGGEYQELLKQIRKHLPDAPVSGSNRLREWEEMEALLRCDVFCHAGSHLDESAKFSLPERLFDAYCQKKTLLVIGPDGPASQLAYEAGGFYAPLSDISSIIGAFQAAAECRKAPDAVGDFRESGRYAADSAIEDLSKLLAYMLPV
ncbi:MAG: hypothetical protein JW989_03010 [Chlorobiaceae bacterium]|nr:hypothetical protein [Chlorobiaceae bacterium]